MENPTDLVQAIRYFSDIDVATEYFAGLRWPDGFSCPHCGGREYSYVSTRRLWKCKSCKKQSSVKVGTILEDSALGLDKWLPAIWLAANPKNGISSHELGRALGTTQKSAWFMLHRIDEAASTWTAAPEPVKPLVARERFRLPDIRLVPAWVVFVVALASFAIGIVVGRLARAARRT